MLRTHSLVCAGWRDAAPGARPAGPGRRAQARAQARAQVRTPPSVLVLAPPSHPQAHAQLKTPGRPTLRARAQSPPLPACRRPAACADPQVVAPACGPGPRRTTAAERWTAGPADAALLDAYRHAFLPPAARRPPLAVSRCLCCALLFPPDSKFGRERRIQETHPFFSEHFTSQVGLPASNRYASRKSIVGQASVRRSRQIFVSEFWICRAPLSFGC